MKKQTSPQMREEVCSIEETFVSLFSQMFLAAFDDDVLEVCAHALAVQVVGRAVVRCRADAFDGGGNGGRLADFHPLVRDGLAQA